MPGRASIGKSTHALTSASSYGGSQSLVTSTPAPAHTAKPKKGAAKTTLLYPIPTKFFPKPIAKPLTAFEKAVLAFDPFKPVKKAAKAIGGAIASAARAVGNIVKKLFSGW